MIDIRSGDILKSDAEALVNTVNCVGVMGRGIALQFKNAYPENFHAYAAACRRSEVQPGRMFVFETGRLTPPRLIVNFPTKRHWRGKSRIEDIEAGLVALAEVIRSRRIRSIAVPPLGSGLGGLQWAEVRPRIEAALGSLIDVDVFLYEPTGAPASLAMTQGRSMPPMTPGRAALVELMHGYLGGLLDPFVTLLEVHKLMYFMQVAGEPLRLKFMKAPTVLTPRICATSSTRSRGITPLAMTAAGTRRTSSCPWCLGPSRLRRRSSSGALGRAPDSRGSPAWSRASSRRLVWSFFLRCTGS